MTPQTPLVGRSGIRLLAATAAGFVVASAFATPAFAEVPGIVGDPVVNLGIAGSVTAGESVPGSITVDYTAAEGSADATHAVAAELAIEGSADVIELTSTDAACDVSTAYLAACTDAAADANTAFGFDLAAVPSADDETFSYTLTVTVDGIEVASRTGTVDVLSTYDVHNPYAHGDVAVTDVASGSSVGVNPVVYQDFDLAPTAEAVVVTFTNPAPDEGALNTAGLATAVDGYANCRTTYEGGTATGLECVITDFAEAKGQFLTLSKAVNYRFANAIVGPLEVCGCDYSVKTIDAGTLADEFDDLSWVPATGTNLSLVSAAAGWDGAEDSIAYYAGGITLTSAKRTYDLEVSETVIEGSVGDTVTVTTEIENYGPAAGPDLDPESNSYLVRAQLPEGVELVGVDSDGAGTWECYDQSDLAALHAATDTALERFDFACAIDEFGSRSRLYITYTVKLTDTTAYQGAVEIGAVYNDGEFEGAPGSDFALIYNDAYEARYDYNGDYYEDLLVIRKSDGALRLYKGTSAGTYGSAVSVGTGWGGFDIVMAGDLTGDGVPDLLARDDKTGTLYTYPGNGNGGFGSRITVGTGWNRMGQISVGHYDGDGIPDLYATSYADGNLYYYPGLGNGKFGARALEGEWWDGMDVLTSIGDLNDDGYDEFLTRWNYDGYYYVYSSTGDVYELDQTLYDWLYTRRYEQVVGVGDVTRDSSPDIASVDLRTGQLVLRTFDPESPASSSGTSVGTGWNAMRLPVTLLDRTYDYDYDGFSDVIAQRKSDKDLYLYWGTGSGLGTRWNMCDNCDGITLASAGGDYNADGRADLLYRSYTGGLYIATGLEGESGFDDTITAGSGWNVMNVLTGGHDLTGDAKDDLVARETSTGVLWLYPGKGDGKFGTRIKMGTGWKAMSEIASVGDLDHDGHADLLALRTSDGCLYFYGGKGNGTLKSAAKVSCGWGGYDQITGVGDFNRDGHADWLARRKSDGSLYLYPGNGNHGAGTRKAIGTGWNSFTIA
ncbi:VCBS repeat-containing protein [Glycomyces sp. NPDC047010]|uniref:FG-GAP repeat domain-containing protein n=1 Tax=Glycomyces sp. NPDC047010 TaxID=3155023 RepID=UPI0033C8FF4E